ncbi:MAG: hemerythrin domain-containing protein, partial [Nitrososphaerales archaeon]
SGATGRSDPTVAGTVAPNLTDDPSAFGEVLQRDHDRLDGLFDSYRGSSAAPSPERLARFAPFAAGLRSHIRFEEAYLFPKYREGSPSRGVVVELMLGEHGRILDALERIEARLATAAADTAALEEELLSELWAHNAREEGEVYPWIDASLSPEEIARLAAQFVGRKDRPGDREGGTPAPG